MKLNYNYIFTLLLVVTIAGLSINASQKMNDEPIMYSIYKGEDIKQAVKKGMKEYKNTFPKLKLEDSDFYVTFGECKDQTVVILGQCKMCSFKDLIASTNRFYVINNDLILPIIFESDKQHSNFFADPDGTRIFVSSEGYMITADEDKKVISSGFSQY